MLGLSGPVLMELAAAPHAPWAQLLLSVAPLASVAALFYAFSVVRFWYREDTARGAWGSFFRGLAGTYRLLDIPPYGPWRRPYILLAVWAFLVCFFISAAVVWALAAATAMPVFLTGNSPFGARLTFVFLASLYVLSCSVLGAFIGRQARLLPAAPFRWLRNAFSAYPWVFLAPTGLLLIPVIPVLLVIAVFWWVIRPSKDRKARYPQSVQGFHIGQD